MTAGQALSCAKCGCTTFHTRGPLRCFSCGTPPQLGPSFIESPCCNRFCGGQWGANCYHCHRTDHVCGQPNPPIGLGTDGYGLPLHHQMPAERALDERLAQGAAVLDNTETTLDANDCRVLLNARSITLRVRP